MFPFDLMSSSKVNLEEKVFLFVAHHQGATTQNIIKELRQFQEREKEEKAEKKVLQILRSLEKRGIIYASQSRNWQMEVSTQWFASSTEEAANYFKAIERRYGVPE